MSLSLECDEDQLNEAQVEVQNVGQEFITKVEELFTSGSKEVAATEKFAKVNQSDTSVNVHGSSGITCDDPGSPPVTSSKVGLIRPRPIASLLACSTELEIPLPSASISTSSLAEYPRALTNPSEPSLECSVMPVTSTPAKILSLTTTSPITHNADASQVNILSSNVRGQLVASKYSLNQTRTPVWELSTPVVSAPISNVVTTYIPTTTISNLRQICPSTVNSSRIRTAKSIRPRLQSPLNAPAVRMNIFSRNVRSSSQSSLNTAKTANTRNVRPIFQNTSTDVRLKSVGVRNSLSARNKREISRTNSVSLLPGYATTSSMTRDSDDFIATGTRFPEVSVRSRSNAASANLNYMMVPITTVPTVNRDSLAVQNTTTPANAVETNARNHFQSKKITTAIATELSPIIDLTEDKCTFAVSDSDAKQITFSENSVKMYPSLMVIAYRFFKCLHPSWPIVNTRCSMGEILKFILRKSPKEFIEWLFEMKLISKHFICNVHVNSELMSMRMRLQLLMNSNDPLHTNEYVRVAECCKKNFSVFRGSIFDVQSVTPLVMIKLIYYWSLQYSVFDIKERITGIDYLSMKNVFANLRAVCTAAVHQQTIGGVGQTVELSIFNLTDESFCGRGNFIKYHIIGVMNRRTKYIRLTAVKSQPEEKKWPKMCVYILKHIKTWLDKETTIIADSIIANSAFTELEYSNIVFANNLSLHPFENLTINKYMKANVKCMFQNTLLYMDVEFAQQFLDELCWRERYGHTPRMTFDNILNHIAEQTAIVANMGESLCNVLGRITKNPFREWKYDNWTVNCLLPVNAPKCVYVPTSRNTQNISYFSPHPVSIANTLETVDVETSISNTQIPNASIQTKKLLLKTERSLKEISVIPVLKNETINAKTAVSNTNGTTVVAKTHETLTKTDDAHISSMNTSSSFKKKGNADTIVRSTSRNKTTINPTTSTAKKGGIVGKASINLPSREAKNDNSITIVPATTNKSKNATKSLLQNNNKKNGIVKSAEFGGNKLVERNKARKRATSTSIDQPENYVPATKKKRKICNVLKYKYTENRINELVNSTVEPSLNNTFIAINSYYYGTLPAKPEILKNLRKIVFTMKCYICGNIFDNNITFMNHLIGHALNMGAFTTDFRCRYCFSCFTSIDLLEQHILERHSTSSNGLQCLICQEKFAKRVTLITHMHLNHNKLELPYECGVCNFRSSAHKKLIDHFYKVHNGGDRIQCPMCLKIVVLVNSANRKLINNVTFFLNHIQKHQLKTLNWKCNGCVLKFTLKTSLKEHQSKDHSSRMEPDVISYTESDAEIMLPAPPDDINKRRNSRIGQTVAVSPYTMRKVDLTKSHLEQGLYCDECSRYVKDVTHFLYYTQCMLCDFSSTCCETMKNHNAFHRNEISPTAVKSPERVVDTMHCKCGFNSSNPDKSTKHLVRCVHKTMYSTKEKAASCALQTCSARFPALVSLDSDEECTNNGSNTTDGSSFCSDILSIFDVSRRSENANNRSSKQTTDDSKEDLSAPDVLSVLGLHRRVTDDRSEHIFDSGADHDSADDVSDQISQATLTPLVNIKEEPI